MVSTGSFIAEMSILGIGLVALFGASYMLSKSENVSNKTKTTSKKSTTSNNLTRRRSSSSDRYSITYKSQKSNSSKQ